MYKEIMIVNKENRLCSDYVPSELEHMGVECCNEESIHLDKWKLCKSACIEVRKLFLNALREDVELVAVSGYRSYARQLQIYESSLRHRGEEYTKKYIAHPGASEHQTGLALDVSCRRIGCELEHSFALTKEGIWLKNNVQNYGFIIRYPKGYSHITGYEYEPWHIRYVGTEVSTYMNRYEIHTLEEYVDMCKKEELRT